MLLCTIAGDGHECRKYWDHAAQAWDVDVSKVATRPGVSRHQIAPVYFAKTVFAAWSACFAASASFCIILHLLVYREVFQNGDLDVVRWSATTWPLINLLTHLGRPPFLWHKVVVLRISKWTWLWYDLGIPKVLDPIHCDSTFHWFWMFHDVPAERVEGGANCWYNAGMPGGAENSVRLDWRYWSFPDFSPQIARWKEALIGLGLRVCYKLLQLLFLGNSPHIFCEPMLLFLAMRPLVYRASQDLGDEHLANMLWRPSRCQQQHWAATKFSLCDVPM